MTQEEIEKQCLCLVYYPQNYNVRAVSDSRENLSNLLSKGWIVERVTQNSEYFADYILKQGVGENGDYTDYTCIQCDDFSTKENPYPNWESLK